MFKIAGPIGGIALLISATHAANAADMNYEQMLGLVVSGQYESWSGYMLYGNESGGFDPDDGTDQFVSGLSGRVSLPLGTNLSIQMDGGLEYASLFEDKKDDLFNDSFLLGTHLSWRDPNSYLIGAFGAFGGGNHDLDATPADFYAIGGEFQIYANDLTFYAQGGILEGYNDNDYLRDAFFGRGVVRWFMSPNSRLQGEFSYVDGTTDNGGDTGDTSILEWGVRYDTMIAGLPLIGDTNIFVGYRGADFDKSGTDPGGFTDHTVMVGFTRHFGANSMKDFDRVGATLDLPNFGRWVAAGEALE